MQRDLMIHFVGIGGIGMSGIAEVLLNQGFRVSGSDLVESDNTQKLRRLGGNIFIGHRAEQIGDCHVVVISSAVSKDNVEIQAARSRRIPVIPRAEMLSELMRLKTGVAIAGAHGKTTTTSMISTIAAAANRDPTFIIGGKLGAIGENARVGQSDLLIAEADESDGSFLLLSPTIAVVTNIDTDHLDHYGNMERLKEAFLSFINKVPFYGKAILCLDNPNVIDLIPDIRKPYITYGLTHQADLRAGQITQSGMETSYTLLLGDKAETKVMLKVPGRHNVLNSLAAIAAGMTMGISMPVILSALQSFSGVERRFQIRGEYQGMTIIEDYAHHPEEIRATLLSAKEGWDRRCIVVFQPHRYTRTQNLMHEFKKAFYQADLLVITDIYPAGEAPIAGVTGESLFEEIWKHGHKNVVYIPQKEEILHFLLKHVGQGDMVFFLGAGDIWRMGKRFLDLLSGEKNG